VESAGADVVTVGTVVVVVVETGAAGLDCNLILYYFKQSLQVNTDIERKRKDKITL